jgi:GNAT superfamily N-acetyltransferase
MPWVVRDAVDEINRAVGRRWQGLDRLLPSRAELPEGCAAPFVATGANGRPAGLAACRHEHVTSVTLSQTWGTADRFSLVARLREADTSAVLDDLIGQWRDHLADLPGTCADDTAAMVTWPARDVSGVVTLLRHGLQPITVIAVRPARTGAVAPRPAGDAGGRPAGGESLVIREAGPADLDVVTELEMGMIRYDALFGAAILRPATGELVRAETQAALAVRPARAWLAERDGEPVGLVHVQPPEESRWITGMTRAGVTAYLQTMFVRPGDRGGGVGEALVRHLHAVLDARGVDTTLLHYAQLNPLSAPFWSRMGYRPLWTGWEVRPAASLR